jgi:PAS domain S-box-containing protein
MSTIHILTLLFVITVNFLLGLLVYLKSSNHSVKMNFAQICLAVIFWTIPLLLTGFFKDPPTIKILRNLAFIAPSFIPPLIMQFSFIFPKKKEVPGLVNFLLFLPAVIFLIIALFGQIVATARLAPNGTVLSLSYHRYNQRLFLIYFVAFSLLAFREILKNYRFSKGLEKMQLRYVFGGLLLAVVGAATTNLILPTLGEFVLINTGPFFSLFFLTAFAYAIVKHQLMDIKIIIRRGLVYSAATITVVFLYLILILVFEKVFTSLAKFTSLPVTLLTVFIIALSFGPILNLIKIIVDGLFFPERISHQKTLEEASHQLTSLINLRDILNLFITTIPKELDISSVRIFLWEESKKSFFLKSAAGELRGRLERTNITEVDPLIRWLKIHEKPLMADILESDTSASLLSEITEVMNLMSAELIVPFFTKKKLIAFIILGPKNSGEMYTKEDLTLLTALAAEGAVAIENAQLYQEVLDMKNYQDDILKAISIGIMSTSLDGRIVTLNPKAEEMLGFSQEEARNKRWYEIIKNPGVKNMIPEILTTGRHYANFETELEHKTGQKISVAINTSFLKNSEKKITGILITLLDLTKLKTLEAQIRQAEKLATMGELVAGVAHEINNPLTTISCYKEILTSYLKEKGTEVEVKTLDGLTTAVDHLKKVVENFLRFARKTQEVWIKTDIKKVISEALTITQPNLNVNKVEVEENYEPDLPEISADHVQLVQVFTNLIINACHAMPKGGLLTITAELDAQHGEIIIQVKDTGVGIPPEDLPKIFDSFFTTKELTKGTGLGLSVSLGIIQKHHGTIDVKSGVGKGSIFTVRLPIAK